MRHLQAALTRIAETFTIDEMRELGREAPRVKLELSHTDLPYFTSLPWLLRESARISWQARPQALVVEVAFPTETVDALQTLYPADRRAHAIASLIEKGGGSFVYAPRPSYTRHVASFRRTAQIPWKADDLADPDGDLTAQVGGVYFDVVRSDVDGTWSAYHNNKAVQRGFKTREQAAQALEHLASGPTGQPVTAQRERPDWPLAAGDVIPYDRLRRKQLQRVDLNQETCPNCDQWLMPGMDGYADCFNECGKRGLAPRKRILPEVPGSPLDAALARLAGDVIPFDRLRQKQQETYCAECGLVIHEDASPGVWVHEDPDDDMDHAAIPDRGYGDL